MSNADGLITLYCDYCDPAHIIGYIDYKPQVENINLIGAQFGCPKVIAERQDKLNSTKGKE